MPGLGSYINSRYLSAANTLNGKNKSNKIIAYVESYDDVFFWRSILSQMETDDLKFQVMLPSRGHSLDRGKKAALMAAFRNSIGPNMIACVDADYDFLKQGINEISDAVCNNRYVFHTYAYSIENLQCWAPALKEVCIMVTLNDSPDTMDFEAFLKEYSEIIYPLFVWNVLSAKYPNYLEFTMPDFNNIIKTGVVVKYHVRDTLKRVEEKVEKKLNQLNKTTSNKVRAEYATLDKKMRELGVKPEETYLYIQGHHFFDNTIVPMLTRECDMLISQRQKEIRNQSRHYTQFDNEISCYEHSIEEVATMLKKNTLYVHSDQVRRVIADIQAFVDLYREQNKQNDNE